jgi:hypothetical protein
MDTLESYLHLGVATKTITQLVRSLCLPLPTTVERIQGSAVFRSTYLRNFPASRTSEIPARPDPDGSVTLVLRVSGRQLPGIKTRNEVGVLSGCEKIPQSPFQQSFATMTGV